MVISFLKTSNDRLGINNSWSFVVIRVCLILRVQRYELFLNPVSFLALKMQNRGVIVIRNFEKNHIDPSENSIFQTETSCSREKSHYGQAPFPPFCATAQLRVDSFPWTCLLLWFSTDRALLLTKGGRFGDQRWQVWWPKVAGLVSKGGRFGQQTCHLWSANMAGLVNKHGRFAEVSTWKGVKNRVTSGLCCATLNRNESVYVAIPRPRRPRHRRCGSGDLGRRYRCCSYRHNRYQRYL